MVREKEGVYTTVLVARIHNSHSVLLRNHVKLNCLSRQEAGAFAHQLMIPTGLDLSPEVYTPQFQTTLACSERALKGKL